MGRDMSGKGKEKRLKRKEEQQRIKASIQVVEKAKSLTDPLAPFAALHNYNRNGIAASLEVKRVADLEEAMKKAVFDLLKQNMKATYEECSWGWNEKEKYEEMMDDDAWYLLARGSDGQLLGFSHFRFDINEGVEVLYCYELQIENHVHRKGLGKFMMQILELMAFTNNMRKVVLTVLKHNPESKFFVHLKYEVDESSPEDDEEETFPYQILSKQNPRLAKLEAAAQVNGSDSPAKPNGLH